MVLDSISHKAHLDTDALGQVDLDSDILKSAVLFLYSTLEAIDQALLNRDSNRMAEMVELANLSSMIGNLFRTGIVRASSGVFISNGPHKHPDLLHQSDLNSDVEIKVALEDNNPKGHLAKPGWHLTCHYVLCQPNGTFVAGRENRGNVARLWLVRFGWLDEQDFNISNTSGDSGKTAVVNAQGMNKLLPVFFIPSFCPLRMTKRSAKSRKIFEHFALVYEPR